MSIWWWIFHELGHLQRICYLGHRGMPSGCFWFWVRG